METSLIPANIEAEKKVVGSMILSPGLSSEIMNELVVGDFYSHNSQLLYDTICRLYIDGISVNLDTIATKLSSHLEALGGYGYLTSLIEGVSPGDYEFWVDEVKKRSHQRKLIGILESYLVQAKTRDDKIVELTSEIENKLISLYGERSSESVAIEVAAEELDDLIERYISDPDGIIGLASGWTKLDKALDGFRPGNVSIIYAPSSRYKSLWTTNLGLSFAQQGIPGLWFTTEMPRVQVLERILQLEAELNIRWLRNEKRIWEFKKEIKDARERLVTYPVFFNDMSALNVDEVRNEVNRHKRWHDIEYVIIDLVDHVSSSMFKDEMVNNQRKVMSSLKAIAKEYNVHIIAVSHIVKGDKELRNASSLDVENMQGSSAKYQDVDVAISIMPIQYTIDGLKGMSREEILTFVGANGWIDINLAVTKNRHGELLNYHMRIDFKKGGIIEPAPSMDNIESNPYYQMRGQLLTSEEE